MDDNNKFNPTSQLGVMATLREIYGDKIPEALAKANPVAQAKIAEAYAQMKHDPTNPDVQKAYNALIEETSQQFENLQKKGLKISKIGDKLPNPYKTSADLINDVKTNNHMAYYPTEVGYGAGDAAAAAQDHPLLKPTKYLDPDGKPMLANDLFRVVHDYEGHVNGGNKFGATGEERAFQQHKKMFSPEAQKALASETRGQNSWVNYGPFGEANRANPAATTYAEQKAGLLPAWAAKDLEAIESPVKYRLKALGKIAGKVAGPAMIGLGAAMAETPEQAVTDLLIPGGLENAGADDREMIAEVNARKNYDSSPARMDALKKLAGK